jgi:phosphoserine phosphatase
MTHVATLISNPSARALDARAIAQVGAALSAGGDPRWLEPGIAADLYFNPQPDLADRTLADRALAALADRPIDVVVQNRKHRRKKLLVADMDSTMIAQECIDEVADKIGLKLPVGAITERAMKGEIAFEAALRERLALLDGVPVSLLGELIRDRIRPNPGAATLVATMRANGAYTCLVSGGFTLFAEPVAKHLGFDEQRANRLIIDGARITGRLEEPVLGPAAKRATLTELRTRFGLAKVETLAVGDGANDVPMLVCAGLGIAYHAKPKVIAAAHGHIKHGDLTALLYLQGYSRGEFVAA